MKVDDRLFEIMTSGKTTGEILDQLKLLNECKELERKQKQLAEKIKDRCTVAIEALDKMMEQLQDEKKKFGKIK